jgi:hypothetical protein
MDKNIVIRLFYSPGCSGCGCGGGCGPDPNLEKFEGLAEKLVEKFGGERLSFEAYNSVDIKKFTFLRDSKTSSGVKTPAVSVGEHIVSSGQMPSLSAIETEVEKALNGVN